MKTVSCQSPGQLHESMPYDISSKVREVKKIEFKNGGGGGGGATVVFAVNNILAVFFKYREIIPINKRE